MPSQFTKKVTPTCGSRSSQAPADRMTPTCLLVTAAMILLIVTPMAQGESFRRDLKESKKSIASSVRGGKGDMKSEKQPKLLKKEKGDDPSRKGPKLSLPSNSSIKSTKASAQPDDTSLDSALKAPKSSKTSLDSALKTTKSSKASFDSALESPKSTKKSRPKVKSSKGVKSTKGVKSSKGGLALKSAGKKKSKARSESKSVSSTIVPTTSLSPSTSSAPSYSSSPSQEISSPTQGPVSNPVSTELLVTIYATMFAVEYVSVEADDVTQAETDSVTDFMCNYLAGISLFQRFGEESVECGPHESNIGIFYEKVSTIFAATFTEDAVPSQIEIDGAIEEAILDPTFLSGVQALGGSFANTEEIQFYTIVTHTIDPYTVTYVFTEGPASDLETELAGNVTCEYLTTAVTTGTIFTFRSNVGSSVECTFAANADTTPLEIVFDTVYTFERQDEQSSPDQVSIRNLPNLTDVEASIQAVFSNEVTGYPDGPPIIDALQNQLPQDNPYTATTGFLLDGEAVN